MGSKGGDQVIGYQYYIGLDFALCHGPVSAVHQINIGDRVMWTGNQVISGDIVIVDKEELFGGPDREGGVGSIPLGGGIIGELFEGTTPVGGDITFAFGENTQVADPYLDDLIAGEVPAYRGILRMIFKSFYIGNNPYIKNLEFLVSRTPTGLSGGTANIGEDANPSYMIFELVTNPKWGMGYTPSDVDMDSFNAAAITLTNEGFGLSMLWSQSVQIKSFIDDIMTHINGAVAMDKSTGKFTLKLIRDDYDVNDLPVFDNSNIVDMLSFSRRSWGETVNEVIVVYRDQETNKDVPIKVQDLASIQIQGQTISQTFQYPGITNSTNAMKVALRDLRTLSSPLAQVSIRVNKDAWDLLPGDVFVLSWPRYGLTQIVMRIAAVDYGTLADGHIRVEAIEDVFGLPSAVYSSNQPSGWVSPLQPPQDIANKSIKEATLWDIIQTIGEDDGTAMAEDSGYILAVGAAPTSNHYSFRINDRVNGSGLPYIERGTGAFAPTATLAVADLKAEAVSTFEYIAGLGVKHLSLGEYIEMGDEYMQLVSHDIENSQITVNRGILDTVPVPHSIGARLYGSQSAKVLNRVIYATGEAVDIKLLSVSGQGVLPLASASNSVYTMTGRKDAPFPPGNLRVEANPAFQEYFMTDGDLDILWNHRDRTQQTGPFVLQGAGSVGPEGGTVYNLVIRDENDVVRQTQNGLSGITYSWTTEEADSGLGRLNSNIRITLESEISGRMSYTKHNYIVRRADYGYSWGGSYGGV